MRSRHGLLLLALMIGGCSIERTAVDVLSGALSSGGDVYTTDDDPELIREALPFGLKTYEGLLNVSPENKRLLLSAARGFAAYAYLLQQDADRIDATDLTRARRLRARSTNLYMRARDYALRGLTVEHENFDRRLYTETQAVLGETEKADAPFLYWAGAAWAGALGTDKSNAELIAALPIAGALVTRVLDLDEAYDSGAAHEFLITYEGTRPGGSAAAARAHYERALALSGGSRAGVYVALAEAVAIAEQNVAEFRQLIRLALAVDPDAAPRQARLVNVIAQQRARWLESRVSDLFFEAE